MQFMSWNNTWNYLHFLHKFRQNLLFCLIPKLRFCSQVRFVMFCTSQPFENFRVFEKFLAKQVSALALELATVAAGPRPNLLLGGSFYDLTRGGNGYFCKSRCQVFAGASVGGVLPRQEQK